MMANVAKFIFRVDSWILQIHSIAARCTHTISLMIQLLRLWGASTAGDTSLIPGLGTKVLHATRHSLFIKKKKKVKKKSAFWVSLVAQTVKNLPAMQETWVWKTWFRKIPWREWHLMPVFWPGEFHGQGSQMGYSLWGHKVWDTTEWFSLSSLTHTLTDTPYITTTPSFTTA